MPGNDAAPVGRTATAAAFTRGLTPEQVVLLRQRRKHAWAAQHAYYERAGILAKLNYVIGVPVVIVTALAGSAIVASHTSDSPIPLWVGVITVSAAVLASLQTFFRFGERAAFSAVAGNRYARLRRRIEDCLVSPPDGLEARLQEIQKLEDDAGDQSPPLGERRWLRWQTFAEFPTPPTRRERLTAVIRQPRAPAGTTGAGGRPS
jgi:hypothetical protein